MNDLPCIQPTFFNVCEFEECICFEWHNGERTLAVWHDADPNECLYHGLSKTEDIEFETVYAAYAWLAGGGSMRKAGAA